MNARSLALFTLLFLLLTGPPVAADTAPSLWLLDGDALHRARARVAAEGPAVLGPLESLRDDAGEAMQAGPFSVTDKKATPPSGDKHDYMSVGPYWWPNPDTDDGLPYIRRDGETNPERHDYDSRTMSRLVSAVEPLALTWYLTGHETYAAKAAALLRTWFLDGATRMNPHLEFGQAIPGRTQGRWVGTIDTHRLLTVIDAAELLRGPRAWTDDDHAALRGWFAAYARWLRDSKHGRGAASARNNIGTWYDVQVVAFGLFADEPDLTEHARGVLEQAKQKRIAAQVEPDGRMPHELARTRSFDYTSFNLLALTSLAMLGERAGVDLWGYETDDGRGLRAALDWFAPFAAGDGPWPHRQITELRRGRAAEVYDRAAAHYGEAMYRRVVRRITADGETGALERIIQAVR